MRCRLAHPFPLSSFRPDPAGVAALYTLVNGSEQDRIPANDRGLMYGDGVFRTLRLRQGRPLDRERHLAKLRNDCAALGIACPPDELLAAELDAVAARFPDGVAKLVVTRGPGDRGYAPKATGAPTRIVSAGPAPVYPEHYRRLGVKVRLCRTRLAQQPALAGIKHLNRLENVIARGEWNDGHTAEGLMLDRDGNLIEGTMSNLFLVVDGGVVTPDLSLCGVAGVQRDRVLEYAAAQGIAATIRPVSVADLQQANEVFLVNSVIGLWPVAGLEAMIWSVGPLTRRLMQALHG